ncbi:hypothetical protein OsJ_30669 [Oryza sativa Japonica Group]|uniref:Uncharacterized protein n=1 Tax=Oryza sativa subsp. japonica TaxID=39947 RepID=A3C2D8_ORYSJ|nr:hypothetical protein OsJ_30669 [Oryza sativa Japonica Group]
MARVTAPITLVLLIYIHLCALHFTSPNSIAFQQLSLVGSSSLSSELAPDHHGRDQCCSVDVVDGEKEQQQQQQEKELQLADLPNDALRSILLRLPSEKCL